MQPRKLPDLVRYTYLYICCGIWFPRVLSASLQAGHDVLRVGVCTADFQEKNLQVRSNYGAQLRPELANKIP